MMQIFESEKAIAHLLADDKCVSSTLLPVKELKEEVGPDLDLTKVENLSFGEVLDALTEDRKNKHLLYGQAVLVSTLSNRNDDVFLPEETWKARFSPVNTPFNQDHESEAIIGHIYGVHVFDQDMKECDIELGECPEFFHIGADFVVYKFIHEDIAKEIVEGFAKGKQFVSMEVKFSGMDYALIDGDGNARIISRNEETSFLSKHLRAYGGEGVYDGKALKRVLRDFNFTGMGNVKNPANPDSVYTSIGKFSFQEEVSETKDNSVLYNTPEVSINTSLFYLQGTIMEIKTVDEAKALIEKQAEDIKAAGEKATKLDQTIAELEGKLELAEKELKTAQDGLAEVTKKATDAEAELNSIKSAQKATARLAELKGLAIAVEDEKAELEKLAKMSDETFASIVAYAKKIKPVEATADNKIDLNKVEEPEVDASASAVNTPSKKEDSTEKAVANFQKVLMDRKAKKTSK